MKLSEIAKVVLDDLKGTQKKEVMQEMVGALIEGNFLDQSVENRAVRALMDREELGSTGIGGGVAVPHARHDSVPELLGAVGRSKSGVEFDSLDGEPVKVVFLLLSSRKESAAHLQALAYIARVVRDANFVRFLIQAKDDQEIRELLQEADERMSEG